MGLLDILVEQVIFLYTLTQKVDQVALWPLSQTVHIQKFFKMYGDIIHFRFLFRMMKRLAAKSQKLYGLVQTL